MMSDDPAGDMLTPPQVITAANKAGVRVTLRTVHNWLDTGKLPVARAEQHGFRTWRYVSREALDAFLAALKKEAK